MAAAVTSLSRVVNLSSSAMTRAIVAGADAAMIDGFIEGSQGIDGSSGAAYFENGGTSTVADYWYSAWVAFDGGASIDFSDARSALVTHFKVASSGFNSIKAVRIILFSSSGSADYAYWEYSLSAGGRDGFYHPMMCVGTPTATGGTWDNTDVTGFGVMAQAEGTDVFAFAMHFDQPVFIDGSAQFGDTGGVTDVALIDFYNLLKRDSAQDYRTTLVKVAGATVEFGFGFNIVAGSYAASTVADGFAFKEADSVGYPAMPASFFEAGFTPPASGTQIYANMAGATNSTDFNLYIDGSASGCDLQFSSCLFAGVNDVEISGANCSMTSSSIVSPETCSIADFNPSGLVINDVTAAIQWTSDLVSSSSFSSNSDIDITFAETDLSDIAITLTASNTLTVSPTTGSGTYDLSGLTTAGTVELDNDTANNTTITLPAGTSNTVASPTAGGGTITVDSPAVTFTFNSDTVATLIRYFEDDSQTIVDSATGTTLAYEYPNTDPVDVEFLKQGYVPVNRQDIVPSDGGTLDIIMDFDEAYNSAHGLTITSQYDYNRATKVLTINSDQEALDVRSSLTDVIRTNTGYYNTPLLMEVIGGLTRVDLINGATITSMATWKGAGCEVFDAADALNPTEKWIAVKSVGTITGATTHYRQTDSGSSTAITLTSNVVNEAFQYWSDPDHDGTPAYDYSDYMLIKSFLAGSKQGRIDVFMSSGLTALNSNLFTVPLSNEDHDYSGIDPAITADITLIAGGTVGGVAFSYEIVDGGTNTGADIADQLNYNAANNPNSVIAGGTGLTYFELGNMVIHNATAVETERGYEEGSTPTLVGFYCSRGGSDHPDFTRFQGDNGTYYTPATSISIINSNLTSGWHVKINNNTQSTVLFNDDLTGSLSESFLFGSGQDIESGDSITYYAMRVDGTNYWEPITGTAIASGGNIEFLDDITVWTDVENWGWDSTPVTGDLTEFAIDGMNIDIDIDDADGISKRTKIVAFWAWALTQSAYIEDFWGGYTVFASNNIRQNDTTVDIVIHNVGTLAVNFNDNDVRYYRVSNDTPYDTSGTSIFMDYTGVPDVVETGVSGLTAPESNELFKNTTILLDTAAIKGAGFDTNTDSLVEIRDNQGGGGDATEAKQDTIIADIAALNDLSSADVTSAVPTSAENADSLLARSIQGGASGGRTVTQALRANRNRVNMVTGAVYEEDDTTVSHTFTVSRADLDAVSEVDPD